MCNCNKRIIPTPKQAVKGAVSIAQNVLGIGKAEPELVQKRRDICRECPQKTVTRPELINTPCKGLTALSQCSLCACIIKQKTMRNDEKCPLGKW